MTCAEAMKLFLAYLDQGLKGRKLHDLEAHLNECMDCCEHLEFSRTVGRFVSTRLAGEAVPPDLARRLEVILRLGDKEG